MRIYHPQPCTRRPACALAVAALCVHFVRAIAERAAAGAMLWWWRWLGCGDVAMTWGADIHQAAARGSKSRKAAKARRGKGSKSRSADSDAPGDEGLYACHELVEAEDARVRRALSRQLPAHTATSVSMTNDGGGDPGRTQPARQGWVPQPGSPWLVVDFETTRHDR
eukprot:COSAG01_NODE_1437_length_10311_cov_11.678613_7_plen_167_part_00